MVPAKAVKFQCANQSNVQQLRKLALVSATTRARHARKRLRANGTGDERVSRSAAMSSGSGSLRLGDGAGWCLSLACLCCLLVAAAVLRCSFQAAILLIAVSAITVRAGACFCANFRGRTAFSTRPSNRTACPAKAPGNASLAPARRVPDLPAPQTHTGAS